MKDNPDDSIVSIALAAATASFFKLAHLIRKRSTPASLAIAVLAVVVVVALASTLVECGSRHVQQGVSHDGPI